MRALLLALTVLLGAGAADGQTATSGDLISHIDSLIASIPSATGSDLYQAPNALERSLWGALIGHTLQAEYATADSLAGILGYRLLEFQDTATPPLGVHYILEKTQGSSNYWGTYVVNPLPLRPDLMIMCPHPRYDSNTGRQGARVYAAALPRMLGISGTHRCNSTAFSPCSGTTTACSSSSESFRISDPAHVTEGIFQVTTQAMLDFSDSTIQIQLHGFAKLATDPDIIMSNGTSITPPPLQDYLVGLRDNLTVVDPSLTYKVGHLDIGWTRLLGTTNVQGRLINGSPAPCTNSASWATGHFLHLEQKYSGLRDNPQGWNKMATAIAMTFPQVPTAVESEETLPPRAFRVRPNFPNPFNPTTTIDVELPEARHTTMTVVDILGRKIDTLLDEVRSAGTTRVQWDASAHPSGTYFCLVQAGEWRAVLPLVLVK